MIDVARNFEMTTVAEGVEDERTLEMLREMEVDLVQGYLIGRPEPLGAGEGEGAGRGPSRAATRSRAARTRSSPSASPGASSWRRG